MKDTKVTPEIIYVKGKIVEYSWGYDQTNIDYYLIIKRTSKTVTLVKIGKKNVEQSGFMQGTCEPDPDNTIDNTPIRRKIHVWDGEERGIAIRDYGWASLWNGKPSHWTAYA